MPRRLLSLITAAILVAGCGSSVATTAPAATSATSATSAPTAAAPTGPAPSTAATGTPAASAPGSTQPYALTLPDGWQTFDLKDPASAAALDSFVAANPGMGASIEAFKKLPNVTMAVNAVLGNVVIALAIPTGGVTLDQLATSFTAQFAVVPGVKTPPVAENITLPVGPAVHWDIQLEANTPGGGTNKVGESVYLVSNGTTAVLVEFVEVADAGIPQEQQIINSLVFTP